MSVDLGSGRGWLNAGPAASIRRIDRELGHPLQITEAGRTWGYQNEHYQRYLRYLAGGPWAPIALHPDTPSVHQVGAAIDSDEAQKHLALMTRHGWVRTVYRNGVLVEPWHFEYRAANDKHRNDTTPAASSKPAAPADPIIEEDDMPVIITNSAKNEWSLLDPDVGTDQPRFTGTAGNNFRSEKVTGGVVNTYRGFMVTTSKAVADAWGRSYCRAYGNAPQQRLGGDYKNAQVEASRLASEKHR